MNLNRQMLLFCLILASQLTGQPIAFQNNPIIQKAVQANQSSNIQQSIDLYDQAAQAFEKAEQWDAYFYTRFKQAWEMNHMDQNEAAEVLLKKTIAQHQNVLADLNALILAELKIELVRSFEYRGRAEEVLSEALDALRIAEHNNDQRGIAHAKNRLGFVMHWSIKPEEASRYFKEALEINTREFGRASWEAAQNLIGLGYIARRKQYDEEAWAYFEEAKKYNKMAKDSITVARILRNQAFILANWQDYTTAQEFCQRGLDIVTRRYGDDHSTIAYSHNVSGNITFPNGKLKEAAHHYKEAYRVAKKVYGPKNGFTIGMMMNQGVVLEKMKAFDKALVIYKKALQIFESEGFMSYDNFKIHRNISIAYAGLGDTINARKSMEQAMLVGQKALEPNSMIWVDGYLDQLRLAPSYERAKQYGQKAFGVLVKKKSAALQLDSTDFERSPNRFSLFRVIAAQADIERKEYQRTGRDEYLIKAQRLSRKGVELSRYIQQHLDSENSKSGFFEFARSHYDLCFFLSWELQQRTPNDPDLMAWVFSLMEGSKSLFLLEALSSQRAKSDATLSEDIRQREKTARMAIDQSYQEMWERQGDEKAVEELQSQLYQLKEDLENVRSEIRTKYPDYYQQKYVIELASIEDVQNELLDDQQLFLQYAFSENRLFALTIDKTGARFHSCSQDTALGQMINDFHQSIKDPARSSREDLASLNQRLSTELLRPLQSLLKTHTALMIVPDGLLNYLPFEVLLLEDEKTKGAPYLIKSHEVAYGFSATTALRLLHKSTSTSNQCLSFAPTFPSQAALANHSPDLTQLSNEVLRNRLAALQGAQEEVEGIQALIPGLSLSGEAATEVMFKKEIDNYGIFHFATHAIVNDKYPLNSYLLLSEEDESEDGRLHAWELYNLELDAQMAVLSACNTGYGQLKEGEGVMSLGRAFIQAGCRSVLMSLWPAQDQSTSGIMIDFYKELVDGAPKATALRSAKLRFLEQADNNFSHPFYWAGFVVQGDTRPLQEAEQEEAWKWLLWCSLVLLGIYLLGRKFRRI